MKVRTFKAVACVLAVAASFHFFNLSRNGKNPLMAVAHAAPQAKQAPAASDASGTADFIWHIFVAAVTPSNGTLTFETWPEQCQLNSKMVGCPSQSAAANKGRRLHGSPLLQRNVGIGKNIVARVATSQSSDECNPMNAKGFPKYGIPAPANLSSNPVFCEEVFVNQPEAEFIKMNQLTTLSGQQAYGNQHSNAITFPWDSVEVKADWVPASSFTNANFSCPDSSHQLYTEMINGTCYALVGIHVSSKALPDWIWATFEPNNSITNPYRCDPKLYDLCFDPWGTTSKQPYGPKQPATQSQALKGLMAQANLDPAFNNYFLTGAQTLFVNGQGKPIPLGSSFVEFNADVDPGQASCITCHKYAYFNGQVPKKGHPEQNFGGPLKGWPATGYACNAQGATQPCLPPAGTTGWTSQDFSWMLGLMPYDNSSSASQKPPKK